MAKIYISVCKNVILSNLKHGTNKPPIRVSNGKYGKPRHVYAFAHGNFVIKYFPNKPAPWGARVWIELDDDSDSAGGWRSDAGYP